MQAERLTPAQWRNQCRRQGQSECREILQHFGINPNQRKQALAEVARQAKSEYEKFPNTSKGRQSRIIASAICELTGYPSRISEIGFVPTWWNESKSTPETTE